MGPCGTPRGGGGVGGEEEKQARFGKIKVHNKARGVRQRGSDS